MRLRLQAAVPGRVGSSPPEGAGPPPADEEDTRRNRAGRQWRGGETASQRRSPGVEEDRRRFSSVPVTLEVELGCDSDRSNGPSSDLKLGYIQFIPVRSGLKHQAGHFVHNKGRGRTRSTLVDVFSGTGRKHVGEKKKKRD